MSRLSPSFVLAYHGCDTQVADDVLCGKSDLNLSKNAYDWLGSGVYFWEADPGRAQHWADDQHRRGKLKNPTVIGAVLDLGNCLNFSTYEGVNLLKAAYGSYVDFRKATNEPVEENDNPKGVSGEDRLLRKLDCAVIEHLHSMLKRENAEPFDTVRGMFREGEEVYPGAGFWERTHVQIAVRDPAKSVVGYFRPRFRPE